MNAPQMHRSLSIAAMSLALAASTGFGYAGTDANPAGTPAPADLLNAPPMVAARAGSNCWITSRSISPATGPSPLIALPRCATGTD